MAKRTLAMIVSVERALRACSLRNTTLAFLGLHSLRGGTRHSALLAQGCMPYYQHTSSSGIQTS